MRKIITILMILCMIPAVLSWADISYSKRIPIDCSNMDANFPFLIGGIDGFEINSQPQTVWTLCGGETLYIYHNDDETDYFIGTDSGAVPFEVEKGDSSSYEPEILWEWNNETSVYHFAETSGNLLDSTANNNDGVVVGNPDRVASCIISTCFDFNETDAKDLINISDDNTLDFPSGVGTFEHTVDAWVRLEGDYSGPNGAPILVKGTGISMNYFYGVDNTAKLNSNNAAANDLSNTPINEDEWTYISYVRNTTHIKFYINGTLDRTVSHSQNSDNNVNLYIGFADDPGGPYSGYMDGKIDELRLYGTVKSDEHISDTYENYQGTSGYGSLGSEEELPAAPVITFVEPQNNSIYRGDLENNLSCIGTNLTELNQTWQGFVIRNQTQNQNRLSFDASMDYFLDGGFPDGVYDLNIDCVDSVGQITEIFHTIELDNTPPQISVTLDNSTPFEDENITFEITCTDTNGIDELRIFDNTSGTLIQTDTVSSPSFPYDYIHTAIIGNIDHRFDCNDNVLFWDEFYSDSNVNQSGIISYTGSETPIPPPTPRTPLPLENVVSIIAMAALVIFIFRVSMRGGKK